MNTVFSKAAGTIGLLGLSAAALAGEPMPATPQEPVGFVTGAVIGGFAAGPVGVIVGAGLGTWLGNRVHRAGDAARAEATVAALRTDKSVLQQVQAVQNTREDGVEVLDGLQGDVLFRTGSADITPEIAHQVQVLAQAVAKSPQLKVRVDGYADPRGTADGNMKLSQARANAVRDLFLAAGIRDDEIEVNAYGKSRSVAVDSDGYALERRVRLTLQAQGGTAVALAGQDGQSRPEGRSDQNE